MHACVFFLSILSSFGAAGGGGVIGTFAPSRAVGVDYGVSHCSYTTGAVSL